MAVEDCDVQRPIVVHTRLAQLDGSSRREERAHAVDVPPLAREPERCAAVVAAGVHAWRASAQALVQNLEVARRGGREKDGAVEPPLVSCVKQASKLLEVADAAKGAW